ncbi:MAG: HindIII family type II restriction endonuclease [Pirellulales bacterium]|nr:HindIII family type II restriction endonuclease [Pirellulales bacterium]
MKTIISKAAIARRAFWVEEIRKLSGVFGDDSDRLEKELAAEIKTSGIPAILGHLRLCGDIPESYGHDTSEEKLYSKYTDSILSQAFRAIGLKSSVIKERADAADVEAFGKLYSFVADAKAFRLSRTAKNQKDFKIQAMDGWKRGKTFAMVVCPIYQLPARTSQIYQQASARNVCIFTYSHLALIVSFSQIEGKESSEKLMHEIFKVIPAINPSKEASAYWLAVNKTMLGFSDKIDPLWKEEKQAAIESIAAAKEEALTYLADERAKIMQMSHEEALDELIRVRKLENRIHTIKSLTYNRILDVR